MLYLCHSTILLVIMTTAAVTGSSSTTNSRLLPPFAARTQSFVSIRSKELFEKRKARRSSRVDSWRSPQHRRAFTTDDPRSLQEEETITIDDLCVELFKDLQIAPEFHGSSCTCVPSDGATIYSGTLEATCVGDFCEECNDDYCGVKTERVIVDIASDRETLYELCADLTGFGDSSSGEARACYKNFESAPLEFGCDFSVDGTACSSCTLIDCLDGGNSFQSFQFDCSNLFPGEAVDYCEQGPLSVNPDTPLASILTSDLDYFRSCNDPATDEPTPEPTFSKYPTLVPLPRTTSSPTNPVTQAPTTSPRPTVVGATKQPTVTPSSSPTTRPTSSFAPTNVFSNTPSNTPTVSVPDQPSMVPSDSPKPTRVISDQPSMVPSDSPRPTRAISDQPSMVPSDSPEPTTAMPTRPVADTAQVCTDVLDALNLDVDETEVCTCNADTLDNEFVKVDCDYEFCTECSEEFGVCSTTTESSLYERDGFKAANDFCIKLTGNVTDTLCFYDVLDLDEPCRIDIFGSEGVQTCDSCMYTKCNDEEYDIIFDCRSILGEGAAANFCRSRDKRSLPTDNAIIALRFDIFPQTSCLRQDPPSPPPAPSVAAPRQTAPPVEKVRDRIETTNAPINFFPTPSPVPTSHGVNQSSFLWKVLAAMLLAQILMVICL